MQCYLINAYVTHKAIAPIRALGQLKFQWSFPLMGVHDKRLKIFSVHSQLARAKKKKKKNNSQKPIFRFASIYGSKCESRTTQRQSECVYPGDLVKAGFILGSPNTSSYSL